MSHGKKIISIAVLAWCFSPALGQSFNVDIGGATSVTPGFGVPSSAHGGAANQPGVWNGVTGTGTGPYPLVGLNGSATGVTLTRSTGAGGDFGFNNANTSGDFELLLDDGQDTGNGSRVYTFHDLAPGTYDVYSYAVGPDSPSFITSVTIAGSTQNIGGAIPSNAYALGVTHALHAGIAVSSVLTVTFAIVTDAGTANGLQLVYSPPPGAACSNWTSPFDDPFEPPGGTVRASTTWDPDGPGGPNTPLLVEGGEFDAGNVVAYGSIMVPLGTESSPVSALTTFNGDLIQSDAFGVIRRWNGKLWQPIGVANGTVAALAVYNNQLVAGGVFSTIGGIAANNIARWNGSLWQPLGSGLQGHVNALVQHGQYLFAGGQFQWPGESCIAKWDGTSWSPMGLPFFGLPNFDCWSLAVHNGELYAGGSFWPYLGPPYNLVSRECVARWDGTHWVKVGVGGPGGPFTDDDKAVYALVSHGGELFAGGDLVHFNGIGRWNGTNWSVVDGGISGGAETVLTLAQHSGRVVAGGDFTNAGDVPAANIAQWDGSAWSPMLPDVPSLDIFALCNFGSGLAMGGDFVAPTALLGSSAKNIVRWDGANLWPIGTGMNATVTALKSFTYPEPLGDTELVAGGLFTIADGVAANYIAHWREDPITPPEGWQPMGAGFNSGVYALERLNNQTIAAGAFTTSGATALNRIARWNETTDVWQPIGAGAGGGMNSAVRALKIYTDPFAGEILVAGGDFTTAGGVAANRIAFWTDGNAVWTAMGAGFNGPVHAIERHDGLTYAAGAFTASGSTTLNRIARYVPFTSSWVVVGNSIGFNGQVQALRSVGNLLYAAGQFTSIDGISANHVAVWNGSSWAPVQGGVNDWALALGLYHNEIHVGGLFTAANYGKVSSPGWAIYQQTGAPWIAYQPYSAVVACGENFTPEVQVAQGYEGLQYQWRKGGANLVNGPTGSGSTISGADTAALEVANVSDADAGNYDVVVSNDCGSVTSLSATLMVECSGPDINGDGVVNTADLLIVINSWGLCPPPCPADLNNDGMVNVADLLIVINNWG